MRVSVHGRSLFGGSLYGDLCPGGICLEESLSRGVSSLFRGSHLCTGGCRGVSVHGGLCQGDHPYGKERPVCILVENW